MPSNLDIRSPLLDLPPEIQEMIFGAVETESLLPLGQVSLHCFILAMSEIYNREIVKSNDKIVLSHSVYAPFFEKGLLSLNQQWVPTVNAIEIENRKKIIGKLEQVLARILPPPTASSFLPLLINLKMKSASHYNEIQQEKKKLILLSKVPDFLSIFYTLASTSVSLKKTRRLFSQAKSESENFFIPKEITDDYLETICSHFGTDFDISGLKENLSPLHKGALLEKAINYIENNPSEDLFIHPYLIHISSLLDVNDQKIILDKLMDLLPDLFKGLSGDASDDDITSLTRLSSIKSIAKMLANHANDNYIRDHITTILEKLTVTDGYNSDDTDSDSDSDSDSDQGSESSTLEANNHSLSYGTSVFLESFSTKNTTTNTLILEKLLPLLSLGGNEHSKKIIAADLIPQFITALPDDDTTHNALLQWINIFGDSESDYRESEDCYRYLYADKVIRHLPSLISRLKNHTELCLTILEKIFTLLKYDARGDYDSSFWKKDIGDYAMAAYVSLFPHCHDLDKLNLLLMDDDKITVKVALKSLPLVLDYYDARTNENFASSFLSHHNGTIRLAAITYLPKVLFILNRKAAQEDVKNQLSHDYEVLCKHIIILMRDKKSKIAIKAILQLRTCLTHLLTDQTAEIYNSIDYIIQNKPHQGYYLLHEGVKNLIPLIFQKLTLEKKDFLFSYLLSTLDISNRDIYLDIGTSLGIIAKIMSVEDDSFRRLEIIQKLSVIISNEKAMGFYEIFSAALEVMTQIINLYKSNALLYLDKIVNFIDSHECWIICLANTLKQLSPYLNQEVIDKILSYKSIFIRGYTSKEITESFIALIETILSKDEKNCSYIICEAIVEAAMTSRFDINYFVKFIEKKLSTLKNDLWRKEIIEKLASKAKAITNTKQYSIAAILIPIWRTISPDDCDKFCDEITDCIFSYKASEDKLIELITIIPKIYHSISNLSQKEKLFSQLLNFQHLKNELIRDVSIAAVIKIIYLSSCDTLSQPSLEEKALLQFNEIIPGQIEYISAYFDMNPIVFLLKISDYFDDPNYHVNDLSRVEKIIHFYIILNVSTKAAFDYYKENVSINDKEYCDLIKPLQYDTMIQYRNHSQLNAKILSVTDTVSKNSKDEKTIEMISYFKDHYRAIKRHP